MESTRVVWSVKQEVLMESGAETLGLEFVLVQNLWWQSVLFFSSLSWKMN